MPPRKRPAVVPELTPAEELDDLESTTEPEPKKVPPSRRKNAPVELVPDPAPEPELDAGKDETDTEMELMLDLIKKEIGVLLDEQSLEMCLSVAEFYRSARRVINPNDNDKDENIEDDDDLSLESDESDDESDDLSLDDEDDSEDDLEDL